MKLRNSFQGFVVVFAHRWLKPFDPLKCHISSFTRRHLKPPPLMLGQRLLSGDDRKRRVVCFLRTIRWQLFWWRSVGGRLTRGRGVIGSLGRSGAGAGSGDHLVIIPLAGVLATYVLLLLPSRSRQENYCSLSGWCSDDGMFWSLHEFVWVLKILLLWLN